MFLTYAKNYMKWIYNALHINCVIVGNLYADQIEFSLKQLELKYWESGKSLEHHLKFKPTKFNFLNIKNEGL